MRHFSICCTQQGFDVSGVATVEVRQAVAGRVLWQEKTEPRTVQHSASDGLRQSRLTLSQLGPGLGPLHLGGRMGPSHTRRDYHRAALRPLAVGDLRLLQAILQGLRAGAAWGHIPNDVCIIHITKSTASQAHTVAHTHTKTRMYVCTRIYMYM